MRRAYAGVVQSRVRGLHQSLHPVTDKGGLAIVTGVEGPRYKVAVPDELSRLIRGVLTDGYQQEVASLLAEERVLKDTILSLGAKEDVVARRCTRYSSRALSLIGAALVAQFSLLFNWVFVVFDWNLVEPVTYFLGYTVVWWSLVFYNSTGKDFTYGSIIEVLQARKRQALEKKDPLLNPQALIESRRKAMEVQDRLRRFQ